MLVYMLLKMLHNLRNMDRREPRTSPIDCRKPAQSIGEIRGIFKTNMKNLTDAFWGGVILHPYQRLISE